jgi:hypothetical protein
VYDFHYWKKSAGAGGAETASLHCAKLPIMTFWLFWIFFDFDVTKSHILDFATKNRLQDILPLVA